MAPVDIPISAKIRLRHSFPETMEIIGVLEKAGVSMIAVHARVKERNRHKGSASLLTVWKVKERATVPILSNGNVI